MKLFRLFLLGVYCSLAFPALAQINIASVDPGPYTPGSTIAATFTIDPASCIAKDNVFELYISDASGNFGTETRIGTYNGFYSTFVNGTIPPTTTPGTGYRLRIKTTNPGFASAPSTPFTIVAGAALEAKITAPVMNSAFPDAFGSCNARDNSTYTLTNASTTASTVVATIKNELTGATTTIPFNTTNKTFNANLAHYTVITRAVKDGTVATKANFIVNNEVKNAFGTGNNDVKCLPSDPLFYNVDVTSTGIGNNFPGNTYVLSWGDGTIETYTICEIIKNGGRVQHMYTESSCGKSVVLNGISEYNVFAINITVESPFCGRVGAPISTTARVATKPDNRFIAPTNACTGSEVSIRNVSYLGENPLTSSPGCEPNRVTYNWYVDGVLEQANMPLSYDFVHTFTKGNHTITLESLTDGACNGTPVTKNICVQDPPQPKFTFSSTTVCGPAVLKPTNTSIVDANCDPAVFYQWVVTPNVGFANGTNASIEPEFNFTTPGVYQVVLQITTASCGVISSTPQTIIVNGNPTATLSPDAALCNIGTYDFNPTTPGPTRTTLEGTFKDEPTTYTWTVTGGQYNFVNSTANSKYPQIQFLDYTSYTISVTHTNSCGTVTDTQVLSFTTAPVVDAGTYAAICYDTPSMPLNGTITGSTGSVTGITWTGGGGTFSDPNSLTSTYTPSNAERAAGLVNLTLTVTTNLPGACSTIADYATIVIKPLVSINSEATKSICTGTAVNYTPTSATAGATFTWTATGSANASGFTSGSGTTINDLLTNTDATTNATVTYTITPSGDGCTGEPFTFTVTITPRPTLTATVANTVICSQQTTGITLNSNLPNVLYTWTSVASGGASGNSSNATPTEITTINEQLFNSGTTTGTVQYTITPISQSGCAGTPQVVTITVEPPPTTPIAGPDESICNAPTYTFKGNQPVVGTGKWTQVTTFSGITITNDTQYNAVASGLQPGNTYIFRWTITGSSSCDPKSADVSITVNPVSVGGTTAGAQTVCANNNNGQLTLTGNVGNIIRWESSTDGGNTWVQLSETSNTYTFNNLSITTQFRAVAKSGACPEATSSITTITVTPGTVIANAGPDQNLCNVTTTTLNANSALPDAGIWEVFSGPAVTFVDPTSPTTQVTGLIPGQTYTFIWKITGAGACGQTTDDVVITVNAPSLGGNADGSTTVCANNNNGSINLTSQIGNVLYWESSTDGFATATRIEQTTVSITYTNLTTTTQYRAIVQNGNCAQATSTIATITVNQPAVIANAGPDQTLCNATTTTLAGNSPLPDNGLWTQISGPTTATITNPTLYNTTVTGLVGGANYVFQWTINGPASCGSTNDQVEIINLPPIQNNTITTQNTTTCTGQTITITGSTPTGGSGSYTYIWESSTTGNAPWTVIPGETGKDLTIPINASISFRRTTTSSVCPSTSNVLSITALPPIANNTIASNQTICEDNTPNLISGSQPTGGDGVNYTYEWEQSTDGINWTTIAGTTTQTYQPGILSQTISYRRIVNSAGCTGPQRSESNIVKITVNPKAKAEFTATQTTGCTGFKIDRNNVKATPYPDRNATYTWYANNVQIGTGIDFPAAGYTISTPDTQVEIKLVVTSSLGCESDEQTMLFNTVQSIEAKFTATPTTVCGTTPVTFKNTSTTLTGVTFEWFIDGQSTSTATDLPTRSFAVDPNGADKTYNVVLRVYSDCGFDDSEIVPITVKTIPPQPALRPSRTSGCSILEVNFDILSTAGSSNTYIVNFGDGTGDQTFNFGQPIVHRFENTGVDSKDYSVMVTATNTCGSVSSTPFNIRVFPAQIQAAFFLGGSQRSQVCVGEEVVFTNNTKGAESYLYDFGDGRGPIPYPATGLTDYVRHVFTAPGPYNVTMIAINSCPSQSAPITIPITVIETPVANFSAETRSGCSGFEVQFRNTSTGATSYEWNFGDGSPTSPAFEPKHTYNGPAGNYTVTLIAKNGLGCPDTETKINYITIAPKPSAEFQVLPGNVIGVPNYTFNFSDLDRTTRPGKTYHWDFGDGEESFAKNPIHTYKDVGPYLVTFTVKNEFGCETASIPQKVEIIGVPGYLYLPNSFIPGGTNVPLQTFAAIGTGIASWRMTIFNKWGQVLWETTKLNDGKPIEGWDGTFKGVAQPQGVYFWKIDVQFINGTEWKGMSYDKSPPKRTGEIYLIR